MRRRASLGARFAFAALFPLLALLAPVLAGDPLEIDLSQRLSPPSAAHWLGTDDLGRDVLARLLYGARVSVAIGLLASALSLLLGSTLGAAGGVAGGAVDRAVIFVIDVVQAFPVLVLVAAGAAFLRPSLTVAAVLIAATSWTDAARIVRAEARRVRGAPFVEAARATGSGLARIVFRHVLPQALPPALATAPYVLGAAVLTEAALSFLGIGTPPPTPSWGRALADARATITDAWWTVVPPAAALLLMVLSARLLGEALAPRRSAPGRPW